MSTNRMAFLIVALMCAASIGAIVARPTARLSAEEPVFSLEAMIPKQFGDWREEPQRTGQVINPETEKLLNKLYSQILARTYVNSSGYHIMLSIAYGSDQHGSLQAHKPEVCYPAQGFVVRKNEPGQLITKYGEIPVRRLFTTKGSRQEPVTYWFTVGGTTVLGTTEKRLVDLKYGLTGRIPDGILFRVSSIDPDQTRANKVQDQFVNQLLQSVPLAARKRLSGLGDS